VKLAFWAAVGFAGSLGGRVNFTFLRTVEALGFKIGFVLLKVVGLLTPLFP